MQTATTEKLTQKQQDLFDYVISVRKEFKLAIEAIEEFNKPYLIGAHISEGINLPSGEKISDIINNIKHNNLLGLILSCVSPENFYENLEEVKNLGVPFGFKLNAFVTTNPKDGYTNSYNVSKTGNPNEFLGQRKDLTPELMANFVKKFKDTGATILEDWNLAQMDEQALHNYIYNEDI